MRDEIEALANLNLEILREIESREYERGGAFAIGEDEWIEEQWEKVAANNLRIEELYNED